VEAIKLLNFKELGRAGKIISQPYIVFHGAWVLRVANAGHARPAKLNDLVQNALFEKVKDVLEPLISPNEI
jgi:hypothetical protein